MRFVSFIFALIIIILILVYVNQTEPERYFSNGIEIIHGGVYEKD